MSRLTAALHAANSSMCANRSMWEIPTDGTALPGINVATSTTRVATAVLANPRAPRLRAGCSDCLTLGI